MPVSRELSVSYAGVTFGGSSARQITGWTLHEEDYEAGRFEFEFVTTAATEAAFKTELDTVRDALRQPRQDLTVTLGAQTILSRKHSDNTGLDTSPSILKDGDPADTGRSRHFRARIEYGIPADNVSTNFRRWSTVNVEFTPERQRIVTVSGVYTANSTDGTTGSFAQYLAQITAYVATILSGIDSTATWEKVGEPQVERNETDKVTTFTLVSKEILHNQKAGTLDDLDIVDPVMEIFRERSAPGDSTAGGFSFAGVQALVQMGAGAGQLRPTVFLGSPGGGGPGQTTTGIERPMKITVTYKCGIDKTRTKALTNKWLSTIRPFLIAEAARVAGQGVVLIREEPGFDDYSNRISATLEFLSYMSRKFEQRITVRDTTNFGRQLEPTTTADPYDYYDFPGPAVRHRQVDIEYKEVVTGQQNPDAILNTLVVEMAGAVVGLQPADKWVPVTNDPAVAVLGQGLVGGKTESIAEVKIQRTARRRNKKSPSVANAGGVTGASLTL